MRGWNGRSVLGAALVVVLAGLSLVACENHNLILTVNTINGTIGVPMPGDGDPGDGVCEVHAGARDCTLRAAIDEGNASESKVPQIEVPSGGYFLTDGVVDDTNAGGDLDIAPASGLMVIHGSRAFAVNNGGDGVFDVHSGQVLLDGFNLTIAPSGPGVRARSGTYVTVRQSRIEGDGVGIQVDAGATAVALDTLSREQGPGDTVVNGGTFTARLSTLVGGLGGTGTTTAAGSIIAGTSPEPACGGAVSSAGFNIFTDGSCGAGVATDLVSTDPLLEGVGMVPAPTSPAVNTIPVGTPVLCDHSLLVDADVNGRSRPFGPGCDRGAVESSVFLLTFVVTTSADGRDASPGDGVCAAMTGACTLRAAADEVNAAPAIATPVIELAADPVLSIAGTHETQNAKGDINLKRDVTIQGKGHTINAHRIDRALTTTTKLALDHVTVTGGAPANNDDGGAATGPRVEVVDSRIVDNHVTGVQALGGGIQGGDILVVRSTIQNNSALTDDPNIEEGAQGGGVYAATISVDESVFIDNRASGLGGGFVCVCSTGGLVLDSSLLHNTASDGAAAVGSALSIVQATIADNVGHSSLFIAASFGRFSVVDNSIFSGPMPLCQWAPGSVNSNATSFATDATCGASTVIADPLLGPPANNGGPTVSRLPVAGSPVVDVFIDTGNTCPTPNDQRGFPRPGGPKCDSGAVERQPTDP